MQDRIHDGTREMENEKLKGVYISKEVHQQIKMLAAKEGKSIKEIAEKLIERELQGNERNDDNDRGKNNNGD